LTLLGHQLYDGDFYILGSFLSPGVILISQTDDYFIFSSFLGFLKGVVHPKILPAFSHPQVVPNLIIFLLDTKEDILMNVCCNQTVVFFFLILWKSIVPHPPGLFSTYPV